MCKRPVSCGPMLQKLKLAQIVLIRNIDENVGLFCLTFLIVPFLLGSKTDINTVQL